LLSENRFAWRREADAAAHARRRESQLEVKPVVVFSSNIRGRCRGGVQENAFATPPKLPRGTNLCRPAAGAFDKSPAHVSPQWGPDLDKSAFDKNAVEPLKLLPANDLHAGAGFGKPTAAALEMPHIWSS